MAVKLLPYDEMVNQLCPLRHPKDPNALCQGHLCYGCTPYHDDDYVANYDVERHYLDDEFRCYTQEDREMTTAKHTPNWYKERGWIFMPYEPNRRTTSIYAHYVEPAASAMKRRTFFCSAMPGAADLGGE